MTLPSIIEKLINREKLPQAMLFSGKNGLEIAEKCIAQWQEISQENVGKNMDTMIFADQGKSFKVDFSEAGKKDGQGENENARKIIEWITKTPLSPYRIICLENLERATNSALNALLKIIEEPPARALFVFTSQNHYQLPATILSRLTVFALPYLENSKEINELSERFFQGKNILERFKIIDELYEGYKKNRQQKVILNFLEDLIRLSRQRNIAWLENILQAHQNIKRNINLRLSLENLALSMSEV
jgi:DNA polymerase III delta prime subunit